jgi:hypothetical protein
LLIVQEERKQSMSEDHSASEPRQAPEELAELIEESFRDIPYPGDSSLVVIRNEFDLERREILEAFAGKHWTTLRLGFLRYHHQSIFFFTPAAYRFYLPAYLLVSVLSYDKAGNIPGSVVFSLTAPEEPGPDMDRFLSRMGGFTTTQKSTIAAFLEFLLAEHSGSFPGNELNLVISRYWVKFK